MHRKGPGGSGRRAVPPEALLDALRRAGDASGFVPFDRFMEVALYGEAVGFYTRAGSPFGPEGDFYTAPRVTPLFGRTIAAHLLEIRRGLGRERPFSIVELGPGDGTLAESILAAMPNVPEGNAEIRYVLVERASGLGRAAVERAAPSARERGIPIRLVESVGELGPFEGAVIANELLDAQPARRLRWTGSEYAELGVRVRDDRLEAAEVPLTRAVPGAPVPPADSPGAIVEISPMSEALVREVADHLAGGVAVFLDYGMEEAELTAAHPKGTLAAVRGHRFVEDPLDDPGETDLSTFVNFSRIREAARCAGLLERSYRSQAESLGAWGFPGLFEEALRAARSSEEEVRLRLSAKNLLFGFERFRVLEFAAPSRRTGPSGAT